MYNCGGLAVVRALRTMVKGGSADVATGKKMDVDAEDIRFLLIILSHASGPISGG